MRARLTRVLAAARAHTTTIADVIGAGLVSFGVGAYSWQAGVVTAGVLILAGSWAASAGESGGDL